jgi:hypothetical protein
MLTNTHAISWSGEKDQQGQHKTKTKTCHDKVPIIPLWPQLIISKGSH